MVGPNVSIQVEKQNILIEYLVHMTILANLCLLEIIHMERAYF